MQLDPGLSLVSTLESYMTMKRFQHFAFNFNFRRYNLVSTQYTKHGVPKVVGLPRAGSSAAGSSAASSRASSVAAPVAGAYTGPLFSST
jgi:hypothetical protein